MSSPARRRRARRAAVALALVLPARAAALDVKLWPLLRYARDEATGDVRWTAFGPLIEFQRTAETRDFFIRPLLRLHQRRGPGHDDRSDILYPLAATRWQEDYQTFRLLLFTYRTGTRAAPAPKETPPAPEWTSRFTLFPFVFYRSSPERGRQLSVAPFYLDLDDFAGYRRVRMVMFPAYLELSEPQVERRYYGFPFVATYGGPGGRGFHVLPFYGTREIVGKERSSYVLWPFHVRSERLVPGYGWERRRLDLPFFAAIDGAGRRVRSYGPFAYTHAVDERKGTESIGAPWPLVFRQRRLGERDWQVWRVFPFYGRSDVRGISSRFYAWPAYRRKSEDVDDYHYERRRVLEFLWRRQTLVNEASGHHEMVTTMFPWLRSEQDDWRAFGQAPALFDSLLPKNRGLLALWAPLYGLVRWDTRPDGARDWSLLWGLAAREDGRLLGPWHLELPHGG